MLDDVSTPTPIDTELIIITIKQTTKNIVKIASDGTESINVDLYQVSCQKRLLSLLKSKDGINLNPY